MTTDRGTSCGFRGKGEKKEEGGSYKILEILGRRRPTTEKRYQRREPSKKVSGSSLSSDWLDLVFLLIVEKKRKESADGSVVRRWSHDFQRNQRAEKPLKGRDDERWLRN